MKNDAIKGVQIAFRDPATWKIALVAGAAIAWLYYWLLTRVTTLPAFFAMVKNGDFGPNSYRYAALYWGSTLATVIFFGVSAGLLAWLWRRSQLAKAVTGSNAFGALVGAFGSACPVCGAFLLSLLGVSGGVAAMPLQGLELKFTSLGLMVGSTVFAARQVKRAEGCEDCDDIAKHVAAARKPSGAVPMEKIITTFLIVLFAVNQLLISRVAAMTGLPSGGVGKLFGVSTATAAVIIAPRLNPDGRTTSLVEQPTITDVPANPNTGDTLADAKAVVLPTGKPFYAPDDIAFDDPINAQRKWGAYERSVKLAGDLEARYQKLIGTMVCSYCCGGPTNVTTINRCGCAHAKAVRGFFRYMLQNYGATYADDQLLGEAHRWYALWYPRGMLEDYLLATGGSEALPHQTHGGAGRDGRHGL